MKHRIAIVAAASSSGEKGGAERFYSGLRGALLDAGFAAELIEVRSDERSFPDVEESYLRFYALGLEGFDGIISSKAPSYVVRHPNHVCYLQHTMRNYYDLFDISFRAPSNRCFERRRFIHALDTAALRAPGTRRIFAIGEEVAQRLWHHNGLKAEVLRHPTSLSGLRNGSFRYLFLPGRLHRWKRIELGIQAMKFIEAPVELIISGKGEDEARLRQLARHDTRVRFVGHVADEELAALYADALAVLFMPRHEDLGLVTLEAFLSGKPVITCTDSGEPARIVRNGESGYVCPPEPRHIASHIAQLIGNPDRAATMGLRGKASIDSISWEHVATTLAAALGFGNGVEECASAQ